MIASIRTSIAHTSAGILSLPEELVGEILRYVKKQVSSAEYCACLKTCRLWHRIGLAYTHADCSISATIESSTRRQNLDEEEPETSVKLVTDLALELYFRIFLTELRSLTIHVLHARIQAPFIAVEGRDLFGSLADTLTLARRLTTFSLRFADQGWDFPHLDVPAVPSSQLSRIVEALLASVVNLEIDTFGTDVPPSESLLRGDMSKHFCHQTGKRIHQLRHLRSWDMQYLTLWLPWGAN